MKPQHYLCLLLTCVLAYTVFGEAKPQASTSIKSNEPLEAEYADVQIPSIPPKGFEKEWSTLSDLNKKIIVRAVTAGPSEKWKNMTEKERTESIAQMEADLKTNPTKPMTDEDYWKKRSSAEFSEYDKTVFRQLTSYRIRQFDLKKKHPNGGVAFDKASKELDAASEKEKKDIEGKYKESKNTGQTGLHDLKQP